MKKNHLLMAFMAIVGMTGCSQNEDFVNVVDNVPNFIGNIEIVGSRTILGDNNEVEWDITNDQVSIFEKDNVNTCYKINSILDGGVATFKFVSYSLPDGDIKTFNNNYAVYPYNKKNVITEEGKITAPILAEYTFTDKQSSIKNALMVAKSSTNKLNFTNAQGIIRLCLKANKPFEYGEIKSIKLKSSNRYLSGTAILDYTESETPSAKILESDGAGQELTITLATPQELPEANKDFLEIYFPIVPTSFEVDDLTLSVEGENETYTKKIDEAFSVGRKEIFVIKHTLGEKNFEGSINGNFTSYIRTFQQLEEACESNESPIYIDGTIDFEGNISYAGALETETNVTLNVNGKKIEAGTPTDYALIAYSNTAIIHNAEIVSGGGGIGAAAGAKVEFNGTSLAVNSTSTSGRYNFYAVGEGTEIIINSGTFSFSKTLNQKRCYIYAGDGAKVVVNGGEFGPASNRSGYTAGILTASGGSVVITGGTFGFDPSLWVADGYEAKKENTTWEVSKIVTE